MFHSIPSLSSALEFVCNQTWQQLCVHWPVVVIVNNKYCKHFCNCVLAVSVCQSWINFKLNHNHIVCSTIHVQSLRKMSVLVCKFRHSKCSTCTVHVLVTFADTSTTTATPCTHMVYPGNNTCKCRSWLALTQEWLQPCIDDRSMTVMDVMIAWTPIRHCEHCIRSVTWLIAHVYSRALVYY